MSVARADEHTEPQAPPTTPRRWHALAFATVGAATVYFSFNAGGFFVFAPAAVLVALLLALVVHATAVARPFAGIGAAGGVAIGALALFAAWTLASALWSDAPARAMIELDRALLYLAALTLFAAAPWSRARLQAVLAGVTAAAVVVAAIALVTRVLPEVWPVGTDVAPDRLSYPLTYWNALGLLAGAGIAGAVHLSSDPAWRLPLRAVACAALPLLAGTLYFTLSRGAMAAAAIGLLLYAAVARPRGLVPTALAAALPVAAVVIAAYGADALTSAEPTSSPAVDQGRRVAVVVAVAIVVAGLLRVALAPLERRLAGLRWRGPVRPRTAAAIAAALAVAALVAAGVPQRVVEGFADSDAVTELADQRDRLLSASNNGRVDHWAVALAAFADHPLIGTGAGTYQLEWAQRRDTGFTVVHAHSLYAQVLGELGVVGLLLLLAALGAVVVGLARRARGPDRVAAGAALALVVMWAVRAGIDWDWEMPAVTWWVFALGGAGLARAATGGAAPALSAWAQRRTVRLLVGVGLLLLCVTPVALGLSQRELDRAARAFKRGDCAEAIDRSLAAIDYVGARPQPYALIGFCDVRLGEDALAIAMLEKAVDRDPRNWEFHYGLALARAAAGEDPRREARLAHRLNPLDPRTRYALQLYARGDREEARRRALAAPLP